MILDTNALSALAARDPALIAKIAKAPRVCVTLITLGEYQFGIRQSAYREELGKWLAAFLERAEVLSPNLPTLPIYADIRLELKKAGTPIPANDVWIAALVRQHGMPILSRDEHFDRVTGIVRLDW
jgi:tRNA(fMet)-specific endonuclease VapC